MTQLARDFDLIPESCRLFGPRDGEHHPGIDDDSLVVKDDIRSLRQIVHHAGDLLMQAAVAPNDRFLPAQEVISLHSPDRTPPLNGGLRLSPHVGSGSRRRGPTSRCSLISYFTADQGKEARARAIPAGTRARPAAGAVHTDMERGFVAAEVVAWDDLVKVGGYAAAREQARLRVEGRDYEMRDGDVVTFRFTPSKP